MNLPVVRQDQCALGNSVTADNVVLCGSMRKGQRCNRVPAVGFLHNGIDVR